MVVKKYWTVKRNVWYQKNDDSKLGQKQSYEEWKASPEHKKWLEGNPYDKISSKKAAEKKVAMINKRMKEGKDPFGE